jgi:Tfp pilus assembly protein FimT
MASTTFIDNQTIIYAAWLNDVNNAVYNGTFPNGVLNATTVNTTNLVTTNASITNLTAGFGNFTIVNSGTKLYFKYNGSNVASLDSSGNFIALANVTAYGTP